MAFVANRPSASYVTADPGALAKAGRNTFPLKPIDNFDILLKKCFAIREACPSIWAHSIGAHFYNISTTRNTLEAVPSDAASVVLPSKLPHRLGSRAIRCFGNFAEFL